jgi:hypothetical protein
MNYAAFNLARQGLPGTNSVLDVEGGKTRLFRRRRTPLKRQPKRWRRSARRT